MWECWTTDWAEGTLMGIFLRSTINCIDASQFLNIHVYRHCHKIILVAHYGLFYISVCKKDAIFLKWYHVPRCVRVDLFTSIHYPKLTCLTPYPFHVFDNYLNSNSSQASGKLTHYMWECVTTEGAQGRGILWGIFLRSDKYQGRCEKIT